MSLRTSNGFARTALARTALALAGILLGGAACGPEYDRTEISSVVLDDLGGGINLTSLRVHEGMIMKSRIVAWSDDREPMSLVLRSGDSSILEVANVITPHDYVFIGKKRGRTQLELEADGQVVLRIDAEVVAQPDAPP